MSNIVREPLRESTNILLYGSGQAVRHFAVGKLIGQGANCLVYDAICTDNGKCVRLKELYPIDASVRRTASGELVWESISEKSCKFKAFEESSAQQINFMNCECMGNSVVHSDGVFKGCGTEYLVMETDFGKTFDKDCTENLHDILKSVLALTRVIKKYHEAGFLHLDIKPENFLIIDETRELIKLFDTDTVVDKDRLTAGNAYFLPCSARWAAPEQRLGRRAKICEATDIYAIGATLFWRIMGRSPENNDIGPFADWEFSGKMFETVNPKVKRLLKTIFRKTLAASPCHRYQSADELEIAIDEAVSVTQAGQPFIISNYRVSTEIFVGRNNELKEMTDFFQSACGENGTIFLFGIGGIGKTELSIQYASRYKSQYDSVAVLDYRKTPSIRGCLETVCLGNYDADKEDTPDRIAQISTICERSNILFILDNFDTENDAALSDFMSLPADKIITTRYDYTYQNGTSVRNISIGPLTHDELIALFESHRGAKTTPEEYTSLSDLLRRVGECTFAVPILARLMAASDSTVDELRHNFLQQEEQVPMVKDGAIQWGTSARLIQCVFNMSNLSESENRALRYLWLLMGIRMSRKEYKAWSGDASLNTINSLIRSNWVQLKKEPECRWKESLELHPLVAELIQSSLKPTTADIGDLVDHFVKASDAFQWNKADWSWSAQPRFALLAISRCLAKPCTGSTKAHILDTLMKILEQAFSVAQNDIEALCHACFDENFSPTDLFGPAIHCGNELPMDNSIVRQQTQLCFFAIRFLPEYWSMLNEWDEYGDDDADAEANACEEWVKKYISVLTGLLTRLFSIAKQAPVREHIQLVMPFVRQWRSILAERSIGTFVTQETFPLHSAMYDLMRDLLKDMIAPNGAYQEEDLTDLLHTMTRSAACMENSAVDNKCDVTDIGLTEALIFGIEELPIGTLLNYKIPTAYRQ